MARVGGIHPEVDPHLLSAEGATMMYKSQDRKGWNGLSTEKRGRTVEWRMSRNALMGTACPATSNLTWAAQERWLWWQRQG